MRFKRMTCLGGVWLIFVALCSFSVVGDLRADCTPGYAVTAADGSTSMWTGTFVPGSLIGHGFDGDQNYYWTVTHILNRCPTPGLSCQESCYYYHVPYWDGPPTIRRYHVRVPAIGACVNPPSGYFDDEVWEHRKTTETVSGQGGNHDYDCDGIPDIADGDPATPNDKNAGRPRMCDASVGNPVNVAIRQ